jgi:hypothetical protein
MTIRSSASTQPWTNRETLDHDCVLHEQIVILFPCGKVLSKEQRSRLKE